MIEVEAKIKISNPNDFKKKALSLGKFLGKTKKIDDYYTLESLKKYPKKSLRIRKIDHKYEINFKQKLSYVKGVHAKEESEFTVSDIKGFLALIKDFGFKKYLVKEKHSQIYEISKLFHIEINNIKKLGWFLEIEYLTNEKNIPKARRQILEIVRKLGISKKKIIKDGYTKLLWDKGLRK